MSVRVSVVPASLLVMACVGEGEGATAQTVLAMSSGGETAFFVVSNNSSFEARVNTGTVAGTGFESNAHRFLRFEKLTTSDGLTTLRWLFSSDGASFTELTNLAFAEDFSSFLQVASGTFAAAGDDPSPGSFRSASAEFCQ